jgi:Tetratricopeptide repeat
LTIFRAIGHRRGQAEALNETGHLLLDASDGAAALRAHHDALRLARDIGHRGEEARAMDGIGRGLIQAGDTGDGVAWLRRALAIYRRTGVPEADRVAAAIGRVVRRDGQPMS